MGNSNDTISISGNFHWKPATPHEFLIMYFIFWTAADQSPYNTFTTLISFFLRKLKKSLFGVRENVSVFFLSFFSISLRSNKKIILTTILFSCSFFSHFFPYPIQIDNTSLPSVCPTEYFFALQGFSSWAISQVYLPVLSGNGCCLTRKKNLFLVIYN